jgi:hypothetical protein
LKANTTDTPPAAPALRLDNALWRPQSTDDQHSCRREFALVHVGNMGLSLAKE